MSDTPLEEGAAAEEKGRKPLLSAVIGGAIAALIGGLFPLLISVFSEDVQLCRVATDFMTSFNNNGQFSATETQQIKALYFEVAEQNCKGEAAG